MSRLIYQYPTDNVAGNATPSCAFGTVDSAKPVTRLYDGNPARPCRITSSSVVELIWDFGSPQSIALVALINTNIPAGATVFIYGNATNSWGAATLSQAITVGAANSDGLRWNPWVDLSAIGHSFQYWLLQIVGTDISIGQVWLGATLRRLARNYSWGFTIDDLRTRIAPQITAGGVQWTYAAMPRRRALSGEIETTDADRAAIIEWHRACGGVDQPMVVIPDPDAGDAWYAKWSVDSPSSQVVFTNDNVVRASWEELGRGAAY